MNILQFILQLLLIPSTARIQRPPRHMPQHLHLLIIQSKSNTQTKHRRKSSHGPPLEENHTETEADGGADGDAGADVVD